MYAQKVLISAFAAYGVAAAASSSTCSNSATTTINSQADATALADCSTYDGSITIGSTASGSIALDGIGQITGDLTSANAGNLVTISSTTINSIGGSFTLNNMTTLSTLQFNALTSVNAISWTALPALPSLLFTKTLTSAKSILITNTFLNSLDGINVASLDTLDVNNNNRLTKFSTQITNVSTSIIIDSNGKLLDVSFPNLAWAANMTIRNVSSITLPSLAVVNGTMGFYGDYLSSISAPNLTTVGTFNTGNGGVAIVANAYLANLTFPLLNSVGGLFQIANNTALKTLDFPSLTEIGGALDFSGNFSTPQLPKLNNVKGGFNMQSTADIDCTGYDKLSGNVVQGTLTCKTTANAQSGVGSSGSTASGTSSSGSSATGTKGAAASYGVNEGLVGLSVIGGLLQMLL